jgi:hypothetical protein
MRGDGEAASRSAHGATDQFADFAFGFGLFATPFGAGFFIEFAAFQFFFDSVELQFLLEKAKGLFYIASYINCDHVISCTSLG